MQSTPSFRLTAPAAPAWDAEQRSLFSAGGLPIASPTAAASLRSRVMDSLKAARVPATLRPAFCDAVCDAHPLDPALMLWLGAPGRSRRWRAQFDAFDAAGEYLSSAAVRARAQTLLVRARATRAWPRRAITVLRRQRTDAGAFDLSTFPPLPPRLRPWRHALLMVALQARAMLYEAFAQPTHSSSTAHSHAVAVLGCFRLTFDLARRDIHVERMNPSGWVEANATADVLRPLPDDAWCRGFALQMGGEVRMSLGATWSDDRIRKEAFSWLAEVVRQLSARSGLLEHVRDRIRGAYPCSAQVINDMRACTIDLRYRQGLSTSEYVWAWRHAEILRTRVAEAPQLAAVWGLALRAGYLAVTDDFDALRKLLHVRDVTTAGWRLLIRHARLLYRPLVSSNPDPKYGFAELCRYLRLLQRAQWREPMPFALIKALFAPHWFSRNLDPAEVPLGLVRGAIDRLKGAMPLGEQDAFIEHEFVPVLGWLARARPELDANQQRAPWRWFLARYRQWCEIERRRLSGQQWTHGIDGLRWRRFDIVPIRDSATLWLDGEQMRMCLSAYTNACVEGRYLVYAVRARGRERPVAHIGLHVDCDGKARLDQVRGFANSPVEPALGLFAQRLAGMHPGSGGN